MPLRCAPSAAGNEAPLNEIVRAARSLDGRPGALVLDGGNPLGRDDVWDLLAAVATVRPAHLGIYSPGHGLTAAVAHRLRATGLQRVHVPFHCARQDAHDWLVGQPGALKTAHRAIRACLEAGLPVTAEIVLTRPTMPHLAETIEVLARVGVRTIYARRLSIQDAPGTTFVPLSPRLALLEAPLEHAATVALSRRVRLSLRGLPVCAAPRLRPLFAAPASDVWVLPNGSVCARTAADLGCAACPGWPRCGGAPDDYVTRFGWEEFTDPVTILPRVHESVEDQQRGEAAEPIAFSWRGPRRVRCEACADIPSEPASVQRHYEPARVIRARLVEAARYRPDFLRIAGADLLAHPEAASLLYDAVRLFPRVEVAGEASAVGDWSDVDLRRLTDLQRVDVALYGPDAATHDAHCRIPGAFASMLRGVDRLRQAGIPVGAYAIIHDARCVPAFAEAWENGSLPGTPRFRLAGRGSSLDELAECARALPPGAGQAALWAVLPHDLREQVGLASGSLNEPAMSNTHDVARHRIHGGRSMPYEPCGSDPIGAFETCEEGADACRISNCPGTAVGWQRTAKRRQWSGSSI